MKVLQVLLLLMAGVSVAAAITPEEIVALLQVKTSEEVILQLIYTNPLKESLTPAQVIELKKNGASERILTALMSGSASVKKELPRQESESFWVDDSARYYYTTSADGEKRLVLTNLDEKGNRMGPPPPPRKKPELSYQEQPTYEPPPPVYVPREQRQMEFRQAAMSSPYSNVSADYPSSGSYPVNYFNPYFIPDFPGSSFGFHLLPQFTVIHPGFGHRPPHCSSPPPQMHHSSRRSSR